MQETLALAGMIAYTWAILVREYVARILPGFALRSISLTNPTFAGIGFMQYHIAKMKVPLENEDLGPKQLIYAADKTLAKVLDRNPIPRRTYSPMRFSFIETYIGISTLVLVRSSLTSEKIIRENWLLAKECLEFAVRGTLNDSNSNEHMDDGCEILYGRAGLIYALLYLRDATKKYDQKERAALENLISDTTISELVDSIVARGKTGARLLSSQSAFRHNGIIGFPPLMWSWHRKRYLGAAHGVGGSKFARSFTILIDLQTQLAFYNSFSAVLIPRFRSTSGTLSRLPCGLQVSKMRTVIGPRSLLTIMEVFSTTNLCSNKTPYSFPSSSLITVLKMVPRSTRCRDLAVQVNSSHLAT